MNDKKDVQGEAESPETRKHWLRVLEVPEDEKHDVPPVVLYRLLKLSNLLTRPFVANLAEPYDMSLNDLRVVMTLAPLHEAASHELADVAGMHPMNVSRAIAALRRRGRIKERRDPNNRRRKLLKLTPEGRRLYKELLPYAQGVADSMLSGMSPLEVEILSKLIDRLIWQLESLDNGANLPKPENSG